MTQERRHTSALEALRMNWPIIVTVLSIVSAAAGIGWRAWANMSGTVARTEIRIGTVEKAVIDIKDGQNNLAKEVRRIVIESKEKEARGREEKLLDQIRQLERENNSLRKKGSKP